MKKIVKRKNGSLYVATISQGEHMADASFEKECDINNIAKRFLKTGHLEHRNPNLGTYADLAAVPDLLEAHTIMEDLSAEFSKLPSATRERFGNDYKSMLSFVSDPINALEAHKMGLIPGKYTPPESKSEPKKDS